MLGQKRSYPNGFERLWCKIDDVRLQNWANMQKGSKFIKTDSNYFYDEEDKTQKNDKKGKFYYNLTVNRY